ncbi:hypothetical protein Hanom_Chr15g01403841 [Helianthus anomalus]
MLNQIICTSCEGTYVIYPYLSQLALSPFSPTNNQIQPHPLPVPHRQHFIASK